jgi:hypothetical protein
MHWFFVFLFFLLICDCKCADGLFLGTARLGAYAVALFIASGLFLGLLGLIRLLLMQMPLELNLVLLGLLIAGLFAGIARESWACLRRHHRRATQD